MKRFTTLVGILLAVGIIFGTFQNFATATPLGWTWFVNLLWLSIGFPVLFGIGWIVMQVLVLGEAEIKKKTEETA